MFAVRWNEAGTFGVLELDDGARLEAEVWASPDGSARVLVLLVVDGLTVWAGLMPVGLA